MKRRGAIVLLVCLAAGCQPPPGRVKVIQMTVDDYEIVGIDPPKHFYLDLKNVKTGRLHKQVYVSKHYNECNKLSVGMKITATYTIWEYSDGSQQGEFVSSEIKAACDKLTR